MKVRKESIRVDEKAAMWVSAGHPWVFRESVRSPSVALTSGRTNGRLVDIQGPKGGVLGRGYFVAEGAIACRVLSNRAEGESTPDLLRRNFERARDLRQRMLPSDLSAFRMIHGDGDGFSGVNVDRFGRFALVYQLCPEAKFLKDALVEWVIESPDIEGVYLQQRFGKRTPGPPPGARLVSGHTAGVEEFAVENGLRFYTDVSAPVSPGLFVDLRNGRSLVGNLAEDLEVLNCFSHTGAFTVYAAAGRAEKVVSVDLSRRYHGWATRNLQLNGLDVSRHEFIASESISALTRMARKGRTFHLAVVDPPSFSTSKKGTLSLARDFPELISSVLSVTAPSGLVFVSCNTARIAEREFMRLMARAAAVARRSLKIVERIGLPYDFPVPPAFIEGHYLKTALFRVD